MNTKDAPKLIIVKQINRNVTKINPWHIVRIDPRVSADGFETIYSITLSNSQIVDISPLDAENKEIMELIEPEKQKKVL